MINTSHKVSGSQISSRQRRSTNISKTSGGRRGGTTDIPRQRRFQAQCQGNLSLTVDSPNGKTKDNLIAQARRYLTFQPSKHPRNCTSRDLGDIMMIRFIRTPYVCAAMPYTPGKHPTDHQSCGSQVPSPSDSYSLSLGALLSTIPMPAE
jgi:hypothetical protein